MGEKGHSAEGSQETVSLEPLKEASSFSPGLHNPLPFSVSDPLLPFFSALITTGFEMLSTNKVLTSEQSNPFSWCNEGHPAWGLGGLTPFLPLTS